MTSKILTVIVSIRAYLATIIKALVISNRRFLALCDEDFDADRRLHANWSGLS